MAQSHALRSHDVGIRVFPSKNSQSVLVDRSLIHYQGFAPVYGDRLKAGELPVPDFQGNRPADFFSNQNPEKEADIHGHVLTHTIASVIHYSVDETPLSEEKATNDDSGFFNSSAPNDLETPPPTEVKIQHPPKEREVRADVGIRYRTFGASGEVGVGPRRQYSNPEGPMSPPNTPTKERSSSFSSSSSVQSNEPAEKLVTRQFAFLSEGKVQKVNVEVHARRSSDKELKAAADILGGTAKTEEKPVTFRERRSGEGGQDSDRISSTSDIPPAPPLDEVALRGSGSSTSISSSQHSSSVQNSPPQIAPRKSTPSGLNPDLLAELKRLDNGNAIQSLAVLKEEEKKLVQEKEQEALERIGKVRKEYTQEKFMSEIPKISEKSGKELPDWQRAMMAKKRAEQAVRDEESKILAELDEWKSRRSPNWKRTSSGPQLNKQNSA